MNPHNDLLRAADDGLDAARGIVFALFAALVIVGLGSLIGAALFGNP